MKKNIWLIITIIFVVTFATLQAVNNTAAQRADTGDGESLDTQM